jgi:hypothetical protein
MSTQWQKMFDDMFPKGVKVYRLDDVPESLGENGFFISAYIRVMEVDDEDKPTIILYPLGKMMKTFQYKVEQIEPNVHTVGGTLITTGDETTPYLVLSRDVSGEDAEFLAEERALFMEDFG